MSQTMNSEFLSRLRCPESGGRLHHEDGDARPGPPGDAVEGWLVSEDSRHRYPIRNGIPRFVPATNYADNFGMQWNKFSQTQLDSHSGHPISAQRFWGATGWSPQDLRGKWVLDVGCGAGRFAEVALEAGANLVALDYSSAVNATRANLSRFPALHVVQGDVYALPFAPGSFDFVYSLGVLQHTPDVRSAFAALPPMVAPSGELCVDYYWKRIRTMLNPKYALRPITRRVAQDRLFALLESTVPAMLRTSQMLGRVPLFGRVLQRFVPIVDYTGIYPLNDRQLQEWALLDTFDMLAPAFDNPQTPATARAWFEQAGFEDVRVFHEGHLVARGRKPAAP
jgi:SAM-dependent methyltransferase